METKIDVSYVCTLPIQGNSPEVKIKGKGKHFIKFIDKDNDEVVKECWVDGNSTIYGGRQWFTNWKILVENDNNKIIFEDNFNAKNKIVFIKMDAYALGDNIAWMPYVEEFRKKHKCHVICSTFFNNFFIRTYPQISFVEPNIKIHNIYAQYYIGANEKENKNYSPVTSIDQPLQKVASKILGLEYKEILPKIHYIPKVNNLTKKYVCISEYASHKKKHWKDIGGWQRLVNFLKEKGYEVIVISKEKTKLKNVTDKSGNFSLNNRIDDILHSEFFIGVSSGLVWLSWALGKKTVLISDGTPHYHEMQSNVLRIGKNMSDPVNWDYLNFTSFEEVKEKILNKWQI